MFPLISSKITQAHGCRRLGRRTAASAATVGAAAIALLIGADFADAAENSPRMAQEQHACAVVMGLHRPGDLYDTCIRSLNKTLSEFDEAQLVSTARSGCVRAGLQPGTPGFAFCVVNAERSPADASPYAGAVPVH